MGNDFLSNMALSTGSSLVTGLLNNQINMSNQRALMREQNKMNIENAKNARLYDVLGMKQAGLSPAIQNGSVPSLPSTNASPIGASISNPLDNVALLSRIDAQNEKDLADAQKARGDNTRANKIIDVQVESLKTGIDKMVNEMQLNDAQKAKVGQETDNLVKQYDVLCKNIDLMVSEIGLNESEKAFVDQQKQNLIAELAKINQDIIESASRTAKNYSDIQKNNSEIMLNGFYANESASRTSLNQAEENVAFWRKYEERAKASIVNFENKVKHKLGVNYFVTKEVSGLVMDGVSTMTDAAKNIGIGIAGAKAGLKGPMRGGYNFTSTSTISH